MVRNWVNNNKKLLILFGICSVVTFLITSILIFLISSNVSELAVYAETKQLTTNLKTIGILGMMDIFCVGIWTLILCAVLIQLFFPTRKDKKIAFYVDEFQFLTQIPKKIRKGVENE